MVTFEGGIMKWSGLLEVAEKGGFIRKPKVGWYEPVDPATGEVLSDKLMRAKEIVNNKAIFQNRHLQVLLNISMVLPLRKKIVNG
jgi:hypothetical protein